MFSTVKSLQGATAGQIFVNDTGYTYFKPMKSKSEAGNVLLEFIQEVGILHAIHTDNAKELTLGKWRDVCKDHGIRMSQTEPYSPFQNRAKVNIRELKKHTSHCMTQTKTPLHLWDLCASYAAEVWCITAQPLISLHGITPYELLTGETPDISEYISFRWYQPVWYYENTSFPQATRHLAQWISIAHNIGQAMCFWVLPQNGIPIARTTVQAINETKLRHINIQEEIKAYDAKIHELIGDQTLNDDTLAFEIGSEEMMQALLEADDHVRYIPVEPEAEKPDRVGIWAEGVYRRYASRFFGTVRSVSRALPRYDTRSEYRIEGPSKSVRCSIHDM